MELNIGETIKYNGVSLIIVEHKNNSCEGCFFSGRTLCPAAVSEIYCSASYSDDNKSIIFKEVEDMETRTIKLTLEKAKEFYKKGGEFRDLALSAFTEKELKGTYLPKTWEEFCILRDIQLGEAYFCQLDGDFRVCEQHNCKRGMHSAMMLPSLKDAEAHLALAQLHQLRDYYRQGWKPDFSDKATKYCVKVKNDYVYLYTSRETSYFLSFQAQDIADEFMENFRDLIIKAGDLL